MIRNRLSPSSSSAPKPKQELPPLGHGLKRVDSFPAQLPSQTRPSTDVKPERYPITRPVPDAIPPIHFQTTGRIHEGSQIKSGVLQNASFSYENVQPIVEANPEYMKIIQSRFPHYKTFTPEAHEDTFILLLNHPRFRAEMAELRNRWNGIPSGATASRTMTPDEQIFLTNALRRLNTEFEKNPFHIHGETAVVGARNGKLLEGNYTPAGQSYADVYPGDKFHLHTHPPLMEPLTSSASELDHINAADLYRLHNNQMVSFVTNGRDVLQIRPDSTELVKLNPDPNLEKALGKFPEAFRLPDPQQPPYPYSNHEAPPAFKKREGLT